MMQPTYLSSPILDLPHRFFWIRLIWITFLGHFWKNLKCRKWGFFPLPHWTSTTRPRHPVFTCCVITLTMKGTTWKANAWLMVSDGNNEKKKKSNFRLRKEINTVGPWTQQKGRADWNGQGTKDTSLPKWDEHRYQRTNKDCDLEKPSGRKIKTAVWRAWDA